MQIVNKDIFEVKKKKKKKKAYMKLACSTVFVLPK